MTLPSRLHLPSSLLRTAVFLRHGFKSGIALRSAAGLGLLTFERGAGKAKLGGRDLSIRYWGTSRIHDSHCFVASGPWTAMHLGLYHVGV